MRSASEHPWTQQNRARIGFAVFPLSAPPGAALRVHAQSQIARTRANFDRFSEEAQKLMDWMVAQAGFELATPRSVVFGKLSAIMAQYLAERKAAVLERISSPEIRLSFLNLFARSAPVWGTRTIWPHLALISERQDWLQRRRRAMCVAVRAGGWTAHEKQNLRRRSGNSGE